jgi:hypothetical protein
MPLILFSITPLSLIFHYFAGPCCRHYCHYFRRFRLCHYADACFDIFRHFADRFHFHYALPLFIFDIAIIDIDISLSMPLILLIDHYAADFAISPIFRR